MARSILVINPNSSRFVTDSIRESLVPVQATTPHEIQCTDLADGPPGIDSDADAEAVAPLIAACIREHTHDAYVLACFSDPGIRELRRRSKSPIFGIGECAYLQATTMGERFGVISTGVEAVARHRRYLASLGIEHRLAADVPLGLAVTDLRSENSTRERVLQVADSLIRGGADVLIMGCAGMSRYQRAIQLEFSRPVIEPTIAATQFALTGFMLT